MANLTITANEVALVKEFETLTVPAGATITAGQICRIEISTGKAIPAYATTTGNLGNVLGVALRSVETGKSVTLVKRGIVDLGTAPLSGVAIESPIYVSDTSGTLADSAGTVSKVVGRVIAGWANTSFDKLLYIDMNL